MSLYEHFKGGYYLKIDEAEHSETGEMLVIYRSIKTGKVYARPKEMFYDNVDTLNYKGKRFIEKTIKPKEIK